MKKTKIICSIGPVSNNYETMKEMVQNGMNCARINLSHADEESIKETINVVCDQTGTPTYARDLADAIVKIIPQLNKTNSGIYHFSNEGTCSWYDFAKTIEYLYKVKNNIPIIINKVITPRIKLSNVIFFSNISLLCSVKCKNISWRTRYVVNC